MTSTVRFHTRLVRRWLLLSLALVAPAFAQDIDPPQFVVPPMATPPTIDGTVAPGEWDNAGAATGFFTFLRHELAEQQPVVLMGYDDVRLYLCIVIPIQRGRTPIAAVTQRDGQVYREDAVEAMLLPPDGQLRHIIVNAIGTVYDAVDGDSSFDGTWQIAAGRARERHLPEALHDTFEAYWGVEMALPFAQWNAAAPKLGDVWHANFAVDGSDARMIAPTFESYTSKDHFARLHFVAADEPFAAIASLGAPRAGRVALGGWLINPTDRAVRYRVAVRAAKHGTHTVEQTGFDEIIGAEARGEVTIDVPAHSREPIRLTRQMDDPRFDRLEVNATLANRTVQVQQQWPYAVRLPFRVDVENSPSYQRANANFDATQLADLPDDATVQWRLSDTAITGEAAIERGRGEAAIDYASLEPGEYALVAELIGNGQTIARAERAIMHPGELPWMNNTIGKADRVVRPFEPLIYDGDTVHAWQREMTFAGGSILPSQMTGANEPLLAAPARLAIETEAGRATFTLDNITWSKREGHRGTFDIAGSAAGFTLSGSGWVEYDGLMWFDLTLHADGEPRTIQSLAIELPIRRQHAQLYHGVPDRALTGPIGNDTLSFPFQYYFWLGSPKRGLGFAIESLEHFYPHDGRHVYDVIPQGDQVLWRVRLISEPTERKSLRYAFGLQATPVKPLPPDVHSWLTGNYDMNGGSMWRSHYRDAMDMAVIWNKGSERYMRTFCDPMGVDTAKLKPIVDDIHSAGVPALLYFAPMQFSEGAQPAHAWFEHEWMIKPRSTWNVSTHQSVQIRASAASSFTDYLLFALHRTATETGAMGFYFDGDMPLADINDVHGAGWTDASGRRHPTYPVLGIRNFMKRLAVMLSEQAEARGASTDDPWPQYHIWSHVSGAVSPVTHSFATNLLCGEWFKGQLRGGALYRDMITRDTFRPRYLSQPWGIPNTFLSICTARAETADMQSQAIFAHILPQGGPLFARYVSEGVWQPIVDAMIVFNTRDARFTPAWDNNPMLAIDGAPGEVLLGTWDRDGEVLAAIGNVGDEAIAITLRSRGSAMQCTTVFPAGETMAPRDAWQITLPPNSIRVMQLQPQQ